MTIPGQWNKDREPHPNVSVVSQKTAGFNRNTGEERGKDYFGTREFLHRVGEHLWALGSDKFDKDNTCQAVSWETAVNNWFELGSTFKTEMVQAPELMDRIKRLEEPETPAVPPRVGVLQEAEKLITGDRNKTYGEPTENFQNIAALWNTQLGHKLVEGQAFTATDVALLMAQVKLARMITQPKRDNFVDLAGYAACGWETQEKEDSGE